MNMTARSRMVFSGPSKITSSHSVFLPVVMIGGCLLVAGVIVISKLYTKLIVIGKQYTKLIVISKLYTKLGVVVSPATTACSCRWS